MEADIFLQGLGRFLRFIIVDLIVEALLYWTGRVCLYCLTQGNPPRNTEKHVNSCVFLGIVFWLIIITSLVTWFS